MVGRVLIVLDGAPEPGSDTTLATARTPALDALCRRGAVSRLRTTPPGLDPGSETGIPTLLGAPPEAPLGRGWIEAAAAGIDVPEGTTPWRLDLRSLDGRRVNAAPLRHTVAVLLPGHRVVRLRGHRLLAIGTDMPRFTVPGVDVTVWPDGAVLAPVLDRDTVMVCGPGAAAGCAELLGLSVHVPLRATGDVDTDLAAKAAAAERALAAGRDVVVHVGALDEAAHRRDPAAKREALERVDRELIVPLSHHTIAVTADHSTCPRTGRHGAEPVPVVAAGPDVAPSGPGRLTERETGAVVASPWESAHGRTAVAPEEVPA